MSVNSTSDRNDHAADGADIAAAATEFRMQRRLRNHNVRKAAELLDQAQLEAAESLLSRHLKKTSTDASALNLLAEIAFKQGSYAKAETLLASCLALEPDFALARFNYAHALYNLNRLPTALAQLDELLEADPHNFLTVDLKSIVLSVMGRHADAMLCRRQLVQDYPCASELWIKYGSALRSLGEREQCIAAWRTAIQLRPSCGSAYWDLADLKTFEFSDAEINGMNDQLSRTDLSRDDRVNFHFALGKAYGVRKDFAKSFENYARANALKRAAVEYDPDSLTRHVAASKRVFTPEFFRGRQGSGSESQEPIFIVGMQRAGSTLVEQILASHSAIEATAELPEISLLAEYVGEQLAPPLGSQYPKVLSRIDAALLRELGERYLETTRYRRVLGRPFFTDKMPYNFLHAGLIQTILPRAKILDVRRHPLGCCFSNFSMNFEVGGPLFSNRLSELGRAYSDYVELMAHFDAVLPGRIHRVFYEDLVREPEAEIRRLLQYLDLPFEEGCLRFHENTRAMSSVSAEQVRKPISGEASEYWRNYEPWLGPLKSALGPILEAYPGVPPFSG